LKGLFAFEHWRDSVGPGRWFYNTVPAMEAAIGLAEYEVARVVEVGGRREETDSPCMLE
jgi:hypothetical protein